MNEELRIKITAVVSDAKQQIRAATKELDSFKNKTKETSLTQEQLSQRVKEQKQELSNLQKEYQSIVSAQGRESAAAVNCAQQIAALSASYTSNVVALNSASVSSGRYGAALLGNAQAGDKVRAAQEKLKQATDSSSKAFKQHASAIDTELQQLRALQDDLEEARRYFEEVSAAMGDNSNEAAEAAQNYYDAADAMASYQKTLDAMGYSLKQATKDSQNLGTEAKKSLKKTQTEADKTENSLTDLQQSLQEVGRVARTALRAMTTAIAAAGIALIGAATGTREYRLEQAKLATAFVSAGSSAEQATQTYNDLYRVLGDTAQATEAANLLAKMTTDQEELSEWTRICQGAYATFGASLPIESLAEAANETAKSGEITGALADALVWAGVSEEKFAEQLFLANSEAEREKLIRETLTGLYGEAADNYEKTAAGILSQNEAQIKLNDAMAKLGEATEPILTVLTEFAAEFLTELTPAVEDFAKDSLPVLKDALEVIGKVLSKVIVFLADNWVWISLITAGLFIIVGAIVAITGILGVMGSAITFIGGIATALGVTFGAALAVIASVIINILVPIGLWIAAIVAVGAAIVGVIFYWDEIVAFFGASIDYLKELFIGLWDKIVEGCAAAWKWIANLLSPITSWINTNIITPIVKFFTELWNKIVSTYHMVMDPWFEIIKRATRIVYDSVVKPVLDYFIDLWNKIKATFSAAASWFNSSVVQPIVKFFSGAWNTLTSGAKKAWDGVKSVFSTVASFFGSIFQAAWQKVLTVFSVGGKIFNGIKEGITSVFKTVVNHIIGGINTVITIPFKAINSALSRLKGIEILGVQPFDWVTTFSIPQIPKLERGGVLKKGQIGLLEGNGAEAVVPLENNTEWLDKIAARLSSAMGGNGAPIVLQVDGKTFAKTAVTTINDLTKQQGKLSLNVI